MKGKTINSSTIKTSWATITNGMLFFHSYKKPKISEVTNVQMTPGINPLNAIARANNKLVMMQEKIGETYCFNAC